jgi:hypothetical protein
MSDAGNANKRANTSIAKSFVFEALGQSPARPAAARTATVRFGDLPSAIALMRLESDIEKIMECPVCA